MKSDGVPKQALGNHTLTTVCATLSMSVTKALRDQDLFDRAGVSWSVARGSSVWQRIPSVARLERGTRTVSWALRTVL